jgi:hypothetical protein
MFMFPITRPDLNRLAGVEPFKGQSFKLVLCPLFSADQALNVGFDSKSLGLRSGAESFFELGMDRDSHGSSAPDPNGNSTLLSGKCRGAVATGRIRKFRRRVRANTGWIPAWEAIS